MRALRHLESVNLTCIDAPQLRRLLAPPHTLRWHSLSQLPLITEDVAPLLTTLPLHELDASEELAMPHCDWLAQLPELTELVLGSACEVAVDAGRILQSVGSCTRLRSLSLIDAEDANGLHFTSAQLSTCLQRLPQLTYLELEYATALTSLNFLVQGSLPRTLTELRLQYFTPHLRMSELQYVLQLRVLRSLCLVDVFDAPLSEADELLLTPPSMRLPLLAEFECE